MKRRVTLQDVALRCDCHRTTVSLALRGDPRLPAETQRKIKQIADEMGYRPDPLMKALASYRTSIGPTGDHGTIAWISNAESSQWKPNYPFRSYVKGALRRADELGYRIEEFCLRAPGMSPTILQRVLRARGIRAIIVAPLPPRSMPARIRMDWSTFSAVAFGYTLAWPRLHVVTNNHSQTVRTAFRKLKSRGYRRIGLCCLRDANDRTNGNFYAGFAIESERMFPGRYPVRPYFYEQTSNLKSRDFDKWFKANRPDALILSSPLEVDQVIEHLRWKSPESLGLVSLSHSSHGYACIDQSVEHIAVTAVDFLVGMIHTNQRGLSPNPSRILIEGTWQDGYTVRPPASKKPPR